MPVDNPAIQLSLAESFLDSIQALEPSTQSKTIDAINRFRSNPEAGGRNLERISNQMLSMRIDLSYRAILSEIESGRNYLMLWVDHHDEAYQWAERRRLVVDGNAVKIVRTGEETENPSQTEPNGLFSRFSARHLRHLGIPEEQLPLIASIQSESDLARIAHELHPSVHEALAYLASGIPLDEVIAMMEIESGNQAACTSTQINSPTARQTIVTLNDDLDLVQIQKMINEPLEKWRVFLHASQRKLVEGNFNGPVKVVGGAGTGKTVVAIHRAKYLAEQIYTHSNDRILLTTFTVNLATEIENNLHKICQPPALSKIDVINVDKLVSTILGRSFPVYQIAYGDSIHALWQQAIEQNQYVGPLAPAFFKEEWSRVAVPQKVKSLQEYLRADRTGRGVRLSRPEKAAVWSIFATYIRLAEDRHTVDIDLAMSMLTEALAQGMIRPPYASIVVDETQDFNRQTLVFLRALAGQEHGNDLFLVGDAHQRIYRNLTRLSHCGIETRGRSLSLRINYRTTEQIRRWAVQLFHGQEIDDLDGQGDNGKGYISLTSGPEPEVITFNSQNEEINHIIHLVQQYASDRQNQQRICIAVRTTQLLDRYKQALEGKGLRLFEIKPNNQDQQDIPGVRIATMHRIKGLEFDHMILSAVNDGIVPLQVALRQAADPVSMKEAEAIERALLYVAATRAKQTLHVLSHGRRSRYLD